MDDALSIGMALSVSGLFVEYQARPVLRDITFSLKRGEFVGLLGPNGAGKTTLLHSITGFIPISKGAIRVFEKDINGLPSKKRAKYLALLPQLVETPFFYSVKEIVSMGAYSRDLSSPKKDLESRVKDLLCRCGIGHLADRPFMRLSGGEKRLALLARCLCQDSPIFLLDEATSSLDIRRKLEVFELLKKETHKKGRTVFIVVHDINLASLFLDRLIFLKNGKIVIDGPVKEVLLEENLEVIYEAKTRVIEHPESRRPVVLFSRNNII